MGSSGIETSRLCYTTHTRNLPILAVFSSSFSSLDLYHSQQHDDLPAQVSALILAKDSVRQVLEVGLLGAAVDGRELGVRVHLRLLGLALTYRLPLAPLFRTA